jgi:hypothetical protein
MVNIESITFKDASWTPVAQKAGPNSRTWARGRDMLILRHFPVPPDIPAPLSRPDVIWKLSRAQSIWKQAAPVDVYTGKIATTEYLGQVVKFSFNGRIGYQGSLIIPKASFSLMFIVAAEGSAADDERESNIQKTVLEGITDVEEKARLWFRDPFSFEVLSPVGRNRADDEEWDEMYPSHPLSRIRAALRDLPAACEIDPEVVSAPAFVGPGPTSNLEQQAAEFAELLTVSDAEQEELVALSGEVTAMIEKVVAESGRDWSTEALFVETPLVAKSDAREFAPQFEAGLPPASHEFANAIAASVSEHKDPKLCLIMYSSERDPAFYQSISYISRLHAAKHNDPKSLQDAEILASTESLHSEFIVSRLLKAVNMRCVSVRSSEPDKCRTGVALIPASETDWFAKFIALCEMSSMIVCGTMLNPNMGMEMGVAFGLERNRAKFLYRSSDGKFHLGSDQKQAFDVRQLPEVMMYLTAKKLGIKVSLGPSNR